MARQAYALRMAAEGAIQGYKQVIGSDRKPFERAETGPNLDGKAAVTQMAAFGWAASVGLGPRSINSTAGGYRLSEWIDSRRVY